jgi:hypothetical protein
MRRPLVVLHFDCEDTSFCSVKIIVELNFNRYYRLLARCEMSSREYAIMKNSIVDYLPDQDRAAATVTIICEIGEARMLLNHANRFYPDATPDIEQSIALAREP